MKKFYLIAALVMGLTAVACNSQTAAEGDAQGAEKVMTAKDYLPSKAEIDSVSYLMGINFGDLNYNEVVKGIKDFMNAEGDPRSADFVKQFKVDPNSMNNAFNTFTEKRNNYTALESKEESDKFLAANAKKAGVTVAESGLQYEIIEKGNEVVPAMSDTLWVRYKGTLVDGTVFDEVPADAEPVRLFLTQVIKGWQEGLQLIGEGGKIKLYIPSNLGYGERGNQAIKPNAALIFDIELTKVGKVAESAE